MASGTGGSNEEVMLNLWVIPEWRDHYIPYTVLKQEIKRLAETVPELQCISRHHLTTLPSRRPKHAKTVAVDNNVPFEVTTSGSSPEVVNASPSHAICGMDRALSSIFEGTRMGSDIILGDENSAVDLAASVTLCRERLVEMFGNTAASFETAALDGSFSGHRTAAGSPLAASKAFRMYVKTRLSDEMHLSIVYLEYACGKIFIQQTCSGISSSGLEMFDFLDPVAGAEAEPATPRPIPREGQVRHQARLVFCTLHEVNVLAMAKLRHFIENVVSFYRKKSYDVAAVAFVLIELSKRKDALSNRERDKLERLFRRLHFTLHMLQEFGDHNHLIASQVVEKLFHVTRQSHESLEAMNHLYFYSKPKVGQVALLEETVRTAFAKYHCDGDESAARERLKLDQARTVNAPISSPMLLVQVGVLMGTIFAFAVASLVIFLHSGENHATATYGSVEAFMFSVSGVVVLLSVLFAVDVVIWERFEINYVFSLHLNPQNHFEGLPLLRDQLMFALVWCVLAFCASYALLEESMIEVEDEAAWEAWSAGWLRGVSPSVVAPPPLDHGVLGIHFHQTTLHSWVWAYAVWPCLAVVFLLQWGWQTVKGRDQWLLRTLWRIVLTPFKRVEFPDFFICEQLVSLTTTLFELQFVWCYFHSDTVSSACGTAYGDRFFVLLILPLWWRVLQSLRRFRDEPFRRGFYPHLLNATKYALSCAAYSVYSFVGISGFESWSDDVKRGLLIAYLVLFAVDNTFKAWYEIWVEFGIARPRAKHFFLRDELLFPKWVYYAATAANVTLRYLWIVKYFAEKKWTSNSDWVFPVFAVIEVLRRAIWNLLRVENDQVSNTESYKLVTFAPSMHHDLPSKAYWDIAAEDIEKSLACGTEALRFFESSVAFFRVLSVSARHRLVQDFATIPSEHQQDEPLDVNSGNSRPANSQDESPIPGVADNVTAEMAPRKSESSKSRQLNFVRDPRSGLLKTSLKYFQEMYNEDRCRALLTHMGDRPLDVYFAELERDGGLDVRGWDDFKNRMASSPPKRSSSFHRSLAADGVAAPTVDHAALETEPFVTVAPSRQVSIHRRPTIGLAAPPS